MKSNGTQDIFSYIFGLQEHHRELYHQSTLGPLAKVSRLISSKFGLSKHQHRLLRHPDILSSSSFLEDYLDEFGMALDYSSSLFQVVDTSSQGDLKFLKFANLSKALDLPAKSMKKIHLPLDLDATIPPFSLQSPLNKTLDALPNFVSWSDISLATNTLIPDSFTVPSILNISPLANFTSQLWFNPHSRAILRQSLRTPSIPIHIIIPPPLLLRPRKPNSFHTPEELPREVTYTDLRGGRGGVWTDKGEWLEWSEICGSFNAEVFGDGKEVFGHEDEGEDVDNSFGQLTGEEKMKEEVKRQEWEQGD